MSVVSCPGVQVSEGESWAGGCRDAVVPVSELRISLQVAAAAAAATHRGLYTLYTMVFYPTIASKYFVKTQTYVALFGPHGLSLIFSGGMYLEVSPL